MGRDDLAHPFHPLGPRFFVQFRVPIGQKRTPPRQDLTKDSIVDMVLLAERSIRVLPHDHRHHNLDHSLEIRNRSVVVVVIIFVVIVVVVMVVILGHPRKKDLPVIQQAGVAQRGPGNIKDLVPIPKGRVQIGDDGRGQDRHHGRMFLLEGIRVQNHPIEFCMERGLQ